MVPLVFMEANMAYVITGYEPAKLFNYFEDITAIPRGSSNEAACAQYILDFAKARGLEAYTDHYHNVIVKKPATAGKELSKPIMLQGHLDMVNETAPGYDHDWDKYGPIITIDDQGIISAVGTTLGADNGAAVAIMLAVLDDAEAVHPDLECVFTVQEETGLTGAKTVDTTLLKARRMINLDSEEEGVLTVSCAGGVRADVTFDGQVDDVEISGIPVAITVAGLKGGHSGADIHLERGNANKIMGRVLHGVAQAVPGMRLVSVHGGSKDNAITRECITELLLPCETCAAKAQQVVTAVGDQVAQELAETDGGVVVTADVGLQANKKVLKQQVAQNLLRFMYMVPNGPMMRNPSLNDFVITSSNLGVVNADCNAVKCTCSLRSSVLSQLENAKAVLAEMAGILGMDVAFREQYPGWAYNPNSQLRDIICATYKDMFETEMWAEAIHAGLECGLFCERLPGMDPVAMGPQLTNVHTPDETMDAASFARTYKLILEVLSRL